MRLPDVGGLRPVRPTSADRAERLGGNVLSCSGNGDQPITLDQPLTNPLTVTGSINSRVIINDSNTGSVGLQPGANIAINKSGGTGGNLTGTIIIKGNADASHFPLVAGCI